MNPSKPIHIIFALVASLGLLCVTAVAGSPGDVPQAAHVSPEAAAAANQIAIAINQQLQQPTPDPVPNAVVLQPPPEPGNPAPPPIDQPPPVDCVPCPGNQCQPGGVCQVPVAQAIVRPGPIRVGVAQAMAQRRANYMARHSFKNHPPSSAGNFATCANFEGVGWTTNGTPPTCVPGPGHVLVADATARGPDGVYRVRLWNRGQTTTNTVSTTNTATTTTTTSTRTRRNGPLARILGRFRK